MQQMKWIVAVFGFCFILFSSVGIAMGAGATSVAVQPSNDTITAGNTSTVDIVVDSASDGVGSIDVELSVTDIAIADVSDTTVAGNPNTVETFGGADSVRITATGMDTPNTGSVRIASVTLTGESAGTSNLDLTVAAIGDESGNSYSITDEFDGELSVESSGDTTPTETPTDTDSSSSDNDASSYSVSDYDETPTSTPTDTPTPTATEQPSEMATEQPTVSQNNTTASTATPTVTNTPTQTTSAKTSEADESSGSPFIIGGAVVAALGGIVVYHRL